MKNLTVLVDLDDVLWHLLEPWVAMINNMHKTDVHYGCVTDWKIAKFFPSLTVEQVFSPLFKEDFWNNVQPVYNGRWFIQNLLNDGHRVKIVTATLSENVPVKMKRFFKLYPMLSWNDVTITHDKQSVNGDVLIDDAPHNLEGGSYHKILFNQPHNRHYDTTQHGITRVYNLSEAYLEILRLCS